MKVEAAPIALPLIRRVPRAKAIACSIGRSGAAVNIAINGRAAVPRWATTAMTPLLKSREARVDPVCIVCPKMTLFGNVDFVF